MRKRNEKEETNHISFGAILFKIRIKNDSTNHQQKRSPKNMEFAAKGVPKWKQNRCQDSSQINAKTCNGKIHEKHKKSCFSEW